jgi:hypothetical protein
MKRFIMCILLACLPSFAGSMLPLQYDEATSTVSAPAEITMGTVNATTVKVSGTVTAGTLVGDISTGDVTCDTLTATGEITATTANVTDVQTVTMTASGEITAATANVTDVQTASMTASGDITATTYHGDLDTGSVSVSEMAPMASAGVLGRVAGAGEMGTIPLNELGLAIVDAGASNSPTSASYFSFKYIPLGPGSDVHSIITWGDMKSALKTYFDTLYAGDASFTSVTASGDITATTYHGSGTELTGLVEDLDGLSDVVITAVAQGAVLYYNGSSWVNLAAGTDGQYLRTQGAGANPVWGTPMGGGNVLGPATNSDAYVPQWDGVNTTTLKNGLATGNASGAIVLRSADNAVAANTIGEVSAASGVTVDGLTIKDAGFALGSDADGDMYYRASGVLTRLAKGTAYQTLVMNPGGTAPSWSTKTRTGVYREIYIPASDFIAATTSGPATGVTETAVNKVMGSGYDFDKDAIEYVQFFCKLPDTFDYGDNLKVQFIWMPTDTGSSGNVVWAFQTIQHNGGRFLDTAWSVASTVTSTGPGDGIVTYATATKVLGITDPIFAFRLSRVATDGGDTFNQDARLLGVAIQYKELTTEPSAW